jgi:hypothetical protein
LPLNWINRSKTARKPDVSFWDIELPRATSMMDAYERATNDNRDAHKDEGEKNGDEPCSSFLLLWGGLRDTEGVDEHAREKE